MDPINIFVGINLVLTFSANMSGAKKGFKQSLTNVKERPKTYLQSLPPNLAMIILVVTILAVFQVGTLNYEANKNLFQLRLVGLVLYIIFSWFQVWAFKKMGDNYSNEIIITKNHSLVTGGPFRFIRHPLYLAQITSDLGAAIALLSYIALPLILIEIPILYMRARYEEKLLSRYFGEQFEVYRKKSGMFLPFLG